MHTSCDHNHCKSTIRSRAKQGLLVGGLFLLIHSLLCPVHGLPALIGLGTWGILQGFHEEIVHSLEFFVPHNRAHQIVDWGAIPISLMVAISMSFIMGWVVKKFGFCKENK